MKRCLIIAKYKEPVEWLSSLEKNWTVKIYSKDPEEISEKLERLPNIGREAHTYFRFIVDHYSDLPDLCVFSQANPYDHCPDFLTKIESVTLPCPYWALSNVEAVFDGYGLPQLAASPLDRSGRTFTEFFQHVLGCSPPALMYCRMNSLFAVDRASILQRPLSFYQSCLAALEGIKPDECRQRFTGNTLEGHFFERMWPFIFGAPKSEHSPLTDMPHDRLHLVAEILSKWPEEFQNAGPMKASRLLLAASEVLNANPG